MVAYGRSRNPGKIDPAALGVVYQSVVESLSPVAYWPMQETSGSTMAALVGSNGTYAGSPTLGAAGPTLSLPNAAQFNGTSQSASVALDVSAYSAITVAAWMYLSVGLDARIIFEHTTNYNVNDGAFIASTNWSAGIFEAAQRGSGGAWSRRVTQPADGVWTHLAARFDRGTDAVTVCLNGVESSVSSGASALTGNFLSSTLYLMSRAGSSLYAAGRLAGFAVFPSYITNDQATLLATAA